MNFTTSESSAKEGFPYTLRLLTIIWLWLSTFSSLNAQSIKDTTTNVEGCSINLYYYLPSSYSHNEPAALIVAYLKSTIQTFIPIANETNSIVIGYDCGGWVDLDINNIKEVIDTIKNWFSIDTTSIYLAGFSNLGSYSRKFVMLDSAYFKGLILVNSVNLWSEFPDSIFNKVITVPHCLLCGEFDGHTPVPWAEGYHNRLVSMGGKSKFIKIPGIGHTDEIPHEYVQKCFEFFLREPMNGENLKIFPNPSSGTIEVLFDRIENSLSTLLIYNSLGVLVYKSELNEGSVMLDLFDLRKGFYIVEIQNGVNTYKEKIIIH